MGSHYSFGSVLASLSPSFTSIKPASSTSSGTVVGTVNTVAVTPTTAIQTMLNPAVSTTIPLDLSALMNLTGGGGSGSRRAPASSSVPAPPSFPAPPPAQTSSQGANDFSASCKQVNGTLINGNVCQLPDGSQVSMQNGKPVCVNAVGQCAQQAAAAAGGGMKTALMLGGAALVALMLLRK
jgi:hypothetical protein